MQGILTLTETNLFPLCSNHKELLRCGRLGTADLESGCKLTFSKQQWEELAASTLLGYNQNPSPSVYSGFNSAPSSSNIQNSTYDNSSGKLTLRCECSVAPGSSAMYGVMVLPHAALLQQPSSAVSLPQI